MGVASKGRGPWKRVREVSQVLFMEPELDIFSRRLLANHVNKCKVATVTGATTELHGGRKRFNRKM